MSDPNWGDMDPDTRRIYEVDGNVMAFSVTRQRVQTGLTFSAEAVDSFLRSINIWIGTRIMRHWKETGEPPTIMNVLVAIGIDHGDPEKVTAERVDVRLLDEALDLARRAVDLYEQVEMDNPMDKELHAEVCEQFRQNYEMIVEAQRRGQAGMNIVDDEPT